jgi:WD40 repeat protein
LASGSKDKTIRLWSLPGGKLLKTLKGFDYPDLAISPDSKLLISSRSYIKIWSLPDGKLLTTFDLLKDAVSLAISPDGTLFASGSISINSGADIKLWSLLDMKQVGCLFDAHLLGYDTTVAKYKQGDTEYTSPCGSSAPAGSVCTCNCVSAKGCSCVGHSGGGGSYWYPN